MLWWARWHPGPAGGNAGRCELRSPESGAPTGGGGNVRRRGRRPALPPPRPPHPPRPGAVGGEGPCDQPAGRVAPLRSRCHPARICKLGRGLDGKGEEDRHRGGQRKF